MNAPDTQLFKSKVECSENEENGWYDKSETRPKLTAEIHKEHWQCVCIPLYSCVKGGETVYRRNAVDSHKLINCFQEI